MLIADMQLQWLWKVWLPGLPKNLCSSENQWKTIGAQGQVHLEQESYPKIGDNVPKTEENFCVRICINEYEIVFIFFAL